jgi:hypothetical protein
MVSSRTEELRRRASAAKALLSRRCNEMDEHRRNSASTFQDYLKAVDVYRAQEEAFQGPARTMLSEKGNHKNEREGTAGVPGVWITQRPRALVR